MSIDEEKLKMWCEQVDRRLDKLEGKDYKPKEPLIGDEATAKFVRAWAEHWGIEEVRVRLFEKGLLALWSRPISIKENGEEIDIQAAFVSGDVEDGGIYTIAELCGEEK